MPRSRILLLTAALAVVIGGGTITVVTATSALAPPAPASTASPTNSTGSSNSTGSAGGFQDPASRVTAVKKTDTRATRVEIPAIGVDSTLEQLALDPATMELTPPVEWQSAGWYRDGTVPGDVGPAVVAGHIDSSTGPAVFVRLGELVPGDDILVTLSTGEVSTFTVDSVATAPKNDFPTARVYGPTPTAQLRVITCDGTFDPATGHYLDNLIVFASLND